MFDDERVRREDDASALAGARERFGDATTLTTPLQRTVPAWNRLAAWLDRLAWSRDESLRALAARHLAVGLAVCLVVLLALLPGVYLRKAPFEFALRVVIAQGLLVGPLSVCLIVVATRLGCALFGRPEERSWRQATIYLVLGASMFPLFVFAWHLALTSDLAGSVRYLLYACCFLPVFPLLFTAIGREAYRELAYERQWASLSLDD